jgi:hypothetical protein
LLLGETDHRPSGEHCFEVFLGVLGVACSTAVPTASRQEKSAGILLKNAKFTG